MKRLLLVHAHPDDETINNGATMARYVAEGAAVTLLTCTLGEEGEVLVSELAQLAADQVCVMQNGKLVEVADTDTVFESPQQEYTQALLNAIPGATLATSVVEAGARPAGE